MPKAKPRSIALKFVAQFRSPLIYLLLIAAMISLWLGDTVDAGFIAGVLLVNAAIGCLQEHRADTSMAALERLISNVARVRRDGAVVLLDARDLVPGDVVEVESGMRVPADIRLIGSHGLSADESLLTGESLPASKDAGAGVPVDAGLGDRRTMLHAGTTIAEGRGLGLVVGTGIRTALGDIEESLRNAQSVAEPPLVLRLERLTKQIAVAAVGLIALLAILLVLKGETPSEILVLSVALAVSAIPEGLPVAVTVALAAATRRMAKRNVIVRSLPAVEGLGACTLIASDKTGTLTLNKLSVERVRLADGTELSPADWEQPADRPGLAKLLRAAALCNEAEWDGKGGLVGDTVDVALLRFAATAGFGPEEATGVCRTAIAPYEPLRKFAAVAVEQDGKIALYAKGAPEVILPMCAGASPDSNGPAEELARAGYRVLALAAGLFDPDACPSCEAPENLQLLGWVALLDPIRPEAASAVQRCAWAGIDVRMVTGDHPATALTIARHLVLADSPDEVVTGKEIERAEGDAEMLSRLVARGRVFARIEPSQKLVIVNTLTAAGELVAVTGDGVNDAPALQAAHIGVAMGKDGTDVARGASDLVLADDNFASIVAGVEEGRITYENIRKIVIFLLATGVAEIGMFLLAVLFALPMPLTAVQLLWSNIVTNGAQDVMLGFGRGEGDELKQPPRHPDEPIIDRTALRLMVPPAIVMSALAILLMHWMLARGASLPEAQNGVLLLTVLFQNVYVLAMRSERRPFHKEPIASNPWLLLGVTLALALHMTALFWPPLQGVLGTRPLGGAELLFCLAGAGFILAVAEITKAIVKRR